MIKRIFQNPVSLGLVALALIVLLSMSVSITPETKQGLITSYGEYRRTVNPYRPNDVIGRSTQAGFTLRIPFVEQITYIDKRLQNVDITMDKVFSSDQLQFNVNAFARYRISNTLRMYQTIRTEESLKNRLRETLDSAARNELGRHPFETLLSAERGQIMLNISAELNKEAKKYGAQIIDVRIKRADFPEGTPLNSAYARMRSAREQQRAEIEALGRREAQEIRAEGEAESARIYALSYGKDPEFYDFYRAMQSYKKTFRKGEGQGETNVILSPNNDYLNKFRNGR